MRNVCILFSGGAYGTFLEWCLNYFSDLSFPETLPFNTDGSSHKFSGNHCIDIEGCKNYINSSINYPFIRCHLRTIENDPVVDNFEYVYNNFKKVIYLHVTKQSLIWTMNNKFDKFFKADWLQHHAQDNNLLKENLKKWGENKTISNINRWELREFLSYFLYDQHVAETDLNNLELFRKKFPNAEFISVEMLRDNFENTLKSLLDRLSLPTVRSNFSEIYDSWIALQYHSYKDKLVTEITKTTILGQNLSWNNLTLIDEAMIQFFLRKNGYETKCFSLNEFPTNSIDLNKLIYEIT